MNDGRFVETVPVRWGRPRRACGQADDAGIRLRTALPLVAVVWEGEAMGQSAVLDVRLRPDASPCLERVALHLDDGVATLRAAGPRTLAGRIETSSSTAPIVCTLFSTERESDTVEP
ncbi:MAG TPA: hypothetical protein VIL20_25655 [Sandaracinaceae bacterium]